MKIYQSKLLKKNPNLIHTFTTRKNGNLAFHVNDNALNVNKNHEALAKLLNYDKNRLIHMKQIHSNSVHIVDEKDNFENPPTCDALITNRVNTPLMVMVADCSPLLFYDASNKVIAVAHAGRQGAFKNIIKNVIDTFTQEYDSDPKSIIVSIGASIGNCCYEVGSEIYSEAKELGFEYAVEKRESNYHLDISKILQSQLLASGVQKQNIEISTECSRCNANKYFSYRADNDTGRFCGLIELK